MKKAVKITIWCASGLLALIAAALITITCYLTPGNLSKLISREMSENFNADVTVRNVRFSLWSTFPRLMMKTDSVIIISHNLDTLPKAQLDALPGNPKMLATASALEGGINIIDLLCGSFVMHDLQVSDLHLNIVAVNDSVNNYDILPIKADEMEKISFFTTNELSFNRPKGIDVYFAASDTKGHIDLDNAVMRRLNTDTTYDLDLQGHITASTGDLTIFNNFPFGVNGNIDLGFHPFNLKFRNFAVNLESLRSNLNMTLDLQGGTQISDLTFQVSMINLMKLFKAFPWIPMGNLSNINTDFDVEISARLDKPYTFSTGELPWVTVTAELEGKTIDYTTSDGDVIPVSFSNIVAGLQFNGDNPDRSHLFLKPVVIRSNGTEMTIGAGADRLLGSPDITMRLNGTSNLSTVAGRLTQFEGWQINGILNFNATATATLESITPAGLRKGLQNVKLSADARIDNLTGSSGTNTFKAGRVTFTASAFPNSLIMQGLLPSNLKELKDMGVGTDIKISNAQCSIEGYKFTASSLNLEASTSGIKKQSNLEDCIEIKFTGKNALVGAPNGEIYTAGDLKASTTLSGILADKPAVEGLTLGAADINITIGRDTRLSFHNATATFGNLRPKASYSGIESAPNPYYITVKADEGLLTPAGASASNPISDIDLYFSPDSLNIHSIGIRCLDSYANISGTAVNLGEFIKTDMKAPLKVNLSIDCDTIDINSLARTYYTGGKEPIAKADNSSDTVTFAIPKNIDAAIDFTARETIYTDLQMYGLKGSVRVAEGKATVDSISVNTDFGHAMVEAVYDTSDIQDISVTANVNMSNLNVAKIFDNFHSLQLMMPEMRNIRGMFDINLRAEMLLFPDMDINIPSVEADVSVKGYDMSIHQSKFIHKIARKLLIKGDQDLDIKAMNIKMLVRDNLVELYPFDFQMENYLLTAEGTNNFNGNLYYHIDIRKSPVPFPFGVNIEGNFNHPKIRLGRAGYDIKKGEEVTLNNQDTPSVNIVREAKYYAREFIRKAANLRP